jgi:hypothetical protein
MEAERNTEGAAKCQRYYFNLFNSIGAVIDEEGVVAEDDEAARRQALASIRSLLSEEVREGRLDLNGRIEVRDEAQVLRMIVRFDEALTIGAATR